MVLHASKESERACGTCLTSTSSIQLSNSDISALQDVLAMPEGVQEGIGQAYNSGRLKASR